MMAGVELVGIHVEILLAGNTDGTIQNFKEYGETEMASQNSLVALFFTLRLNLCEQGMTIDNLSLWTSPVC